MGTVVLRASTLWDLLTEELSGLDVAELVYVPSTAGNVRCNAPVLHVRPED